MKKSKSNAAWRKYQEQAASFFQSLNLDTTVDQTIKGVRTNHAVDVLVKMHQVGFDVTWLVECKLWKTPVTKLHVFALREIVTDTGADRGIILSESGFQSGAIEAANLTNVRLTSLANIRKTASHDIFALRLRELFDAVEDSKERYWEISKEKRIKFGLRPDIAQYGFSARLIIDFAGQVLSKALRGSYPIKSEADVVFIMKELPRTFSDPEAVLATIEPLIKEIQIRLTAAENDDPKQPKLDVEGV